MIQFYKPNQSNRGFAFSFNLSKQKGKFCFFINTIQQATWNNETKTGTFLGNKGNEEKHISVKLSPIEAAGIAALIDRTYVRNDGNYPYTWSAYHSSSDAMGSDNKTILSFYAYNNKNLKKTIIAGKEQLKPVINYSLSITRNSTNKFFISFSFDEGWRLKYFLENGLRIIDEENFRRFDKPKTNVVTENGDGEINFE